MEGYYHPCLSISKAARDVVIDQTGGLHEGIADRGAYESKSVTLEGFAHGG